MPVERQGKKKFVKTIAVASGKGGVGKTNVVVNLAIAMKKPGRNVMIVDADLGLSNIDVLLDLAPRHSINHVIRGGMALKDVIMEGPHGIKILPAGSGVQEITALDEFQRLKIIEEFDSLSGELDVMLIDTSSGISETVAFFCIAAQETVIVTSPEPTAVTDAYALIKVLSTRHQEKEFCILVNSVKDSAEGFEVFRRLSLAAEKFLNISLDYLGYIPYDESVQRAVRAQKAFIDLYPEAPASRQINDLATILLERAEKVKGTLQFFIGNLVSAKIVPAA